MTTFAAVAAPFGRDLDASFARIEGLVADARARAYAGVAAIRVPGGLHRTDIAAGV